MNTSGTGSTLTINASTAVGNQGVTLGGTTGSGNADILNLNLKDSTVLGTVEAFGTITAPNVETVNIAINDSRTTTVPNQAANTVTLTDASVTAIKVTGNQSLSLTHTAGTALTSVDASGMTLGGLTFTSNANQYSTTVTGSAKGGDALNFAAATAAVTITETAGTNSITGSSTIASTLIGGSGIDTIVGGAGKDTIVAGAGTTANTITGAAAADTIDLTGSAGVDTLIYGAKSTTISSSGANVDTITNFASGTDKIQLTAGAGAASSLGFTIAANDTLAAMGAVVTDATSVATIADVYTQLAIDLLNATNAFAASTSGVGALVARVVTFTTGAAAGSYLVINDGNISFQAANDMVIKLTGTTTFAAGDLTVV